MFGNNGTRVASWIIGKLPVSRCLKFKIWLLRTIGGIEIGDGCEIWSGARFSGSAIKIGRNCHFGEGAYINGRQPGSITIGDEVSCGPEVYMTTGTHDIGDSKRRSGPGKQLPIVVGDGCGLSLRAMIMAGVTIGKGCLIGPGVLVAKDIPDNTMLGQGKPRQHKLPEFQVEW